MKTTLGVRAGRARGLRVRRGDSRCRPVLERFEERCLLSVGVAGAGASVAPLALAPTQTNLVYLDLPIPSGGSESVSAYVSPTSGGGTPTGDVVFTVDGVAQPPIALQNSGGSTFADFPAATLPVGPHTIDATYEGDSTFASSTAPAPVPVQVATVNETNVSPRVPAPVGIAQSPLDHNFYITEAGQNKIAQVDRTTGQVTESPAIPTTNALPFGVAVASDGTVYFTEFNGNKIGAYDPTTQKFHEYGISTANSGPWGIAVASNGDVYFTEFLTGRIGVLNPHSGVINDSGLPGQDVGGSPAGLVAGPTGDANLYYVNSQNDTVGSITSTVDANGDLTSFSTNDVPIPSLSTSSPDPSPLGVAIGPDGKVWFTEANAAAIGRWDQAVNNPSGVTSYALPNSVGTPLGITAGPNNTLEYTDFSGNEIGVFDATNQTFGAVPITAPLAGLFGITTDTIDHSIWFTETIANQFGRFAATPVATAATTAVAAQPSLTETPLPNSTGGPFGITVGPDNAIWFTESASSTIDRYDLGTKTVTDRVPTPTPNSRPLGITVGPGGALYYTEGSGKIGVYDPANPAGATELAIPTANSGPLAIAYDPAANALFFTESTANKIGEYNATTGQVTEYKIPTTLSLPTGITLGPDGNLWFTEANSGKIGEFSPTNPAVIHEYSLPAQSNVNPTQITTGPGNDLYFTTSGDSIGKFNPANPSGMQLFQLTSTTLAGNYGLARGPDGNLYYTGLFVPEAGIFNDTLKGLSNATLPVPSVLPGAFDIVAGPDGNLYFAEYLAGNLAQIQLAATPTGLATTTTLAKGTPNPSNYGQTVSFTATVTSAATAAAVSSSPGQITGDVTFTVDGVDQPPVPLQGNGTITGSTATYTSSTLKPGPHTVRARYDGDANYAASLPSNQVTQDVNKVATATNLQPGTPNPSVAGNAVTFHITMLPQQFTGDQPAGNFVLYVDGNAVKSFPLTGTGSGYFGTVTYAFPTSGAHKVTAAYLGDTSYAASPPSSAVTQTVRGLAPFPTTVILNVTPGTVYAGQNVTLKALIEPDYSSAPSGLIGVEPPTGSVVFSIDGRSLAPVAIAYVNGVGEVATLSMHANLSIGTHQIVARYTGDTNYEPSPTTAPKPLVVVAAPVAGPTVTSVTRYGYHWMPTELVVGLSTALDPTRAQSTANYSLRIAGTSISIPIVSARYNPTTHQVTLLPARLLPLKYTYILTVNGTPPFGLTSTSGVYLSGAGQNHPGTNFITRITRRNLSLAPAPPLPPLTTTAARSVPGGPALLLRRGTV